MKLPRLLPAVAFCTAAFSLAACGSAADRKSAYVEKGEAFLQQKNYEKARVEFRNALQIDPRDARAHERAGLAAERLGELREAAGQYQAAVDLDATRVESRAALARLFVVGGVPDRALELLGPGLVATPAQGELLTARAAAKASLGDIAGSRADAEAAYLGTPEDPYTISMLASLRKRDGEVEPALVVARAGVERLPENVDLRVVLADLLLERGLTSDAEQQLKKAVDLEPANGQRRVFLAQFYLAQHNVDAAEKVVRGAIEASPDDVKAKIALGDFLAQYRGVAAGEAELARWIKADPKNEDLKLGLGAFQVRQNKIEAAMETYRQLVVSAERRPAGLVARDRLAELALGRGDAGTAEQLIGEVLAENPRDADALIMRSNLAVGRGDPAAGIADLRTVLRDQPDSIPVLRLLARAHLQQHEPALAEEALNNAVQAHPRDIDVRMDLAQVLAQNGKTKQAREIVEAVARETPDNLPVQKALFEVRLAQDQLGAANDIALSLQKGRPELALGYVLGGLVAERQQRLADATRQYERAQLLEPNTTEPLAALVRLDVAQRHPERALDRLDRVIAAQPDNLYARSLKGATQVAQKQFIPAVRTYEAIVERQPRLASGYSNLAGAHLANHEDEAAVASLRRGIQTSSDPGRLVTELAILLERRGQLRDAASVYEEALQKTPSSELLINNYAMLLVNHHDDEPSQRRAIELADRLSASQNAGFIDTRGWVYFKTGRQDQALPLLQSAVERAPESPALRYHLAMAQQHSGNLSDARTNLERAVQSGRKFEGEDEARKTLKLLKDASS